MLTTTPLGTIQLPTATGGIPLDINLETGRATDPTPTAVTSVAAATAAGQPSHVAITVVGEVDNHAIDLGVRREDITVKDLPTEIDLLVRTEPVAQLITEYQQRLADLTIQLAGLGLAAPDRVPVVFSVDDLEYLRQCLGILERRWREAIDDADTAARQPQRNLPASPGHINVQPTRAGYRTAARLFDAELERVQEFGQRLNGLLDLAHTAAGEHGELP
jgi:hypothetical protein